MADVYLPRRLYLIGSEDYGVRSLQTLREGGLLIAVPGRARGKIVLIP